MIINKRILDVKTEKENEDLRSKVEDQASIIDYITMMTGVDIPSDESTEAIENVTE